MARSYHVKLQHWEYTEWRTPENNNNDDNNIVWKIPIWLTSVGLAHARPNYSELSSYILFYPVCVSFQLVCTSYQPVCTSFQLVCIPIWLYAFSPRWQWTDNILTVNKYYVCVSPSSLLAVTILNTAPGVKGLTQEYFQNTDILCLNETEVSLIYNLIHYAPALRIHVYKHGCTYMAKQTSCFICSMYLLL